MLIRFNADLRKQNEQDGSTEIRSRLLGNDKTLLSFSRAPRKLPAWDLVKKRSALPKCGEPLQSPLPEAGNHVSSRGLFRLRVGDIPKIFHGCF